MPLPANGTPWPPVQLAVPQAKYTEWAAWYSGDTLALERAYQRTTAVRPSLRPSQFQGGFVGSIARMFWGVPNNTNMPKTKLHVPIAGDLCQLSGDLLFAEPPTFTVDGAADLQDRLDELVDDGMLTMLAEAAEIGAALGDVYLRVTWDPQVCPDGPFGTVVHADSVWPEFRWGRLTAATVWHVIQRNGQQVWRHLERHELDADGNGVIMHGLYQGTDSDLGIAVPLSDVPETADIVLNDDGVITTDSPGLALVHVPNMRPQRRWRNEPLASNFGRSDLDGVEGLMDQFDEVYNSWMRDIRLGKARLLLGQGALENLDPGTGLAFDTDREIFTQLNLPPGSMRPDGGTSSIAQSSQFAIRYAEHQATADELLNKILRTAGYSMQTYGDAADGGPVTATEVEARERRSFMTRDRKVRIWRPALAQYLAKLLWIDKVMFDGPGSGDAEVEFADGVQESMLSLAQTALALSQAEAASTAVRVGLVHPEWDPEQVREEVALIVSEQPTVPDPSTFMQDGPTDPAAVADPPPVDQDPTGAGQS